MKKKRSIILLIVFVFSMAFSTIVLAEDTSECENLNVSDTPPIDYGEDNSVGVYGVKPPDSDSQIHNVKTSGEYNFRGDAEISVLYTDKWITGKTKYHIYVKNNHSNTLTIKLRSTFKTYSTVTVQSGAIRSYYVTVDKASKKVYLEFSSPSLFSGYIE